MDSKSLIKQQRPGKEKVPPTYTQNLLFQPLAFPCWSVGQVWADHHLLPGVNSPQAMTSPILREDPAVAFLGQLRGSVLLWDGTLERDSEAICFHSEPGHGSMDPVCLPNLVLGYFPSSFLDCEKVPNAINPFHHTTVPCAEPEEVSLEK